jgi:hypothetical protein
MGCAGGAGIRFRFKNGSKRMLTYPDPSLEGGEKAGFVFVLKTIRFKLREGGGFDGHGWAPMGNGARRQKASLLIVAHKF